MVSLVMLVLSTFEFWLVFWSLALEFPTIKFKFLFLLVVGLSLFVFVDESKGFLMKDVSVSII